MKQDAVYLNNKKMGYEKYLERINKEKLKNKTVGKP
jgi:hypothetical protein